MQEADPITLNAPLVLLTGAAGWLGGRVAAALTMGLPEAGLLATGGLRVRALVSAGEDVSQLREEGVEIMTGDMRDMESVRALMAGAARCIESHGSESPKPDKCSVMCPKSTCVKACDFRSIGA